MAASRSSRPAGSTASRSTPSERTRSSGATRLNNAAGSGKRKKGSNWKRHGTALPTWTDLEHTNTRRYAPSSSEVFLERVSTFRFALVVIILAAAFTAYVGHVNATQQLLADVQQAETENRALHIQHNYLQGERARQTGPAVIHERARALGLEETVAFGVPIPRDP